MLTIAESLSKVVRAGCLRFDGMTVRSSEPGPSPGPPEETPALIARMSGVRRMYRAMGLDPTKTRPSSEALLRRVRRGRPWPAVNTLVDTVNACSLAAQLPFGLYDLDHVDGPVVLRRGRPDEEYRGIGKAVVHLGGRPALCDLQGPFGNPTSDSARTMVTPATTRGLVVVFSPRSLDARELAAVLKLTSLRVGETAGGRETARAILPLEAVGADDGGPE